VAPPKVVTAALDSGCPVVVLVHSFMSDEVWSSTDELRAYEEAERTILRAASGVICTSRWSADRVARLYGRSDASVAHHRSDP
jgi:hypothetical protein